MIRLRKARGAILFNATNKIREAGRPNPISENLRKKEKKNAQNSRKNENGNI